VQRKRKRNKRSPKKLEERRGQWLARSLGNQSGMEVLCFLGVFGVGNCTLERAGVEGMGEGEMEEEESGSKESPLKIVL